MKKKIKKSPYATLSQKPVKSPSRSSSGIRAERLEGGDLRVKGGEADGK